MAFRIVAVWRRPSVEYFVLFFRRKRGCLGMVPKGQNVPAPVRFKSAGDPFCVCDSPSPVGVDRVARVQIEPRRQGPQLIDA
jgi:hypothetical protein